MIGLVNLFMAGVVFAILLDEIGSEDNVGATWSWIICSTNVAAGTYAMQQL